MIILDDSPEPLSEDEIAENIKNKYGLEFTAEEIINSIQFNKEKYIKTILDEHINHFSGKTKSIKRKLFSITEEGRTRISRKTTEKFNSILNKFICEENLSVSIEELNNLLSKFIYGVINYNISDLMKLCNINLQNINISATFKSIEFTNQEKDLINNFLYWNSSEKNKLLYKLISFSIDFCMLTMKRNINSFKPIFNGKVFYLDSNIIFRFMGINNEKRQKSTENFINICKKANIKLKYTSETYDELNSSIEYHIKILTQISNGFENFDCDVMNNFVSKFNNSEDYFKLYYKWKSEHKNLNININDFKNWIKIKLNECLQNFEIDRTSEKTWTNKKEEIKNCISELGKVKYKELNNYNLKILETDASNYIFIQQKRYHEKGNNYINLNNYLITYDQNLVIYDREKRKEKAPIVTLPSVWQSILLKIYGRTDDDFAAFVEFIALRKNTDNLETEIEINLLQKIQQSNEIDEIKQLTLIKINEIIKNDLNQFIENEKISEEKIEKCILKAEEIAKDDYEKNIIKNTRPLIEAEYSKSLIKKKVDFKVNKIIILYKHSILFKKILRVLITISLIILIFNLILITKDFNIENWIEESFKINYCTISVLFTLVCTILNSFCNLINYILFRNGDKEKLEKKYYKKYADEFKL